MIWRLIVFIALVLAGGLLGLVLSIDIDKTSVNDLHNLPGVAAGMLVAAVLLVALDTWRMSRVLDWVKANNLDPAPIKSGWWGDLAYRVQRRLRQMNTSLTESEKRLEDFLGAIQASPTGVILLAPDGRIEWFNQMSAQHFGLNIQRDLQQFFVNLARDPAVAKYFNEADFTHDMVMMGRSSSPTRPVRLSVQIYPYGQGRQLLLSRDVTSLEQAEAMRRDFVANVSHEIRTPLTVMSGFIETLQTLSLEKVDQDNYLKLMGEQAQRMQSLVDDLLVLSRLEGNPLPGEYEWVDLGDLLQKVKREAELLSAHLAGLGQKTHVIEMTWLPVISLAGAASEMISALTNLVNNAVRYTPAGASVEVHSSMLDDGRLAIAVRDTGQGIAPEHLPRLTERFYRVDRSRSRESGGTGLGLAIVKHVMQRHGGELKIESQLGKGSCFTLVFPASRVRVTQTPSTTQT
jgi:two-component system phosphate regulon sensor histidine kinase PhoR